MIGFRRYFVFVFKRFTRGCIIKIENKKHNFKFRSPVPNHMLWRGSYSQFSVMAGCVSYLCWAECRRFLQSLAPPMPRAGFDEIYGVHMYVRIYIVLRVFSYISTSYMYWRHLVIYIERLWYGLAYLFQLYSLWLLYYNLILAISIHLHSLCSRLCWSKLLKATHKFLTRVRHRMSDVWQPTPLSPPCRLPRPSEVTSPIKRIHSG